MTKNKPNPLAKPELDVETIRAALAENKRIDWREAAEFLLVKLDASEKGAAVLLQSCRNEMLDGVLNDD